MLDKQILNSQAEQGDDALQGPFKKRCLGVGPKFWFAKVPEDCLERPGRRQSIVHVICSLMEAAHRRGKTISNKILVVRGMSGAPEGLGVLTPLSELIDNMMLLAEKEAVATPSRNARAGQRR